MSDTAPQSYGRVQIIFEDYDNEESDFALSEGLRDEVRAALSESVLIERVLADDANLADADTHAFFAIRRRNGELSFDLLPWPAFSLRRELRYRLRMIDAQSGVVLLDVDRDLITQGPQALEPIDQKWIAVDLARLVAPDMRPSNPRRLILR
ncbi:MAG: hypothetical protein AB8G23_05710 [Myxococcota bacterium]